MRGGKKILLTMTKPPALTLSEQQSTDAYAIVQYSPYLQLSPNVNMISKFHELSILSGVHVIAR